MIFFKQSYAVIDVLYKRRRCPIFRRILYNIILDRLSLSVSLNCKYKFLVLIVMMQFFDMPKYDAIKALVVYKRAGQQVYISIL